jgi:hypothetical protein
MQMEPVWVWESVGKQRRLSAVEDGALFLLGKWPEEDKGSKTHLAAQIAALQALEGTGSAMAFRLLFVEALRRVELLGSGPDQTTTSLPAHIARPWDMPWAKKRRRRKP